MKVRLMGTQAECRTVLAVLDKSDEVTVVEVSPPYPNRAGSDLVRVYAEVRAEVTR